MASEVRKPSPDPNRLQIYRMKGEELHKTTLTCRNAYMMQSKLQVKLITMVSP